MIPEMEMLIGKKKWRTVKILTHNPPNFQAYGREKQPALNIDFDKVMIARVGLKIRFLKITHAP